MARWKIWFIDGTTFDSTQGSPADAPAQGVVCIAQPDVETGREILNRWPAYYRARGRWHRASFNSVFDRLLSRQTVNAYLEGAIPGNSQFRSIWLAAKNEIDPELGVRTGRTGDESPYNKEPGFMDL